jgi:hypothetical protein
MPDAMQVAAQTMPSRWAFEGGILLEAKERTRQPEPPPPLNQNFRSTDVAEGVFPEDKRTSPSAAFAALILMLMIFSSSVLVVLRLRDVH